MHWRYFQFIVLFAFLGICSTNLSTCTSILPAEAPLQKFKRYKPGSYSAKLYDIQHRKHLHTEAFEEAKTIDERFDIVFFSEKQIAEMVEKEIFPHWYDTKYDFYGQTETPGKGKIACGYFVSTVLRDIGVPIERV